MHQLERIIRYAIRVVEGRKKHRKEPGMFHLFEFKDEEEENIRTTGYVIDTIEAVFWC